MPVSREPFLNRERATSLMRIAGLDAIVASSPLNVYYLTGAFPVMSRFSQLNVTACC
jgi:Xaa-Pro aminopeptidase